MKWKRRRETKAMERGKRWRECKEEKKIVGEAKAKKKKKREIKEKQRNGMWNETKAREWKPTGMNVKNGKNE